MRCIICFWVQESRSIGYSILVSHQPFLADMELASHHCASKKISHVWICPQGTTARRMLCGFSDFNSSTDDFYATSAFAIGMDTHDLHIPRAVWLRHGPFLATTRNYFGYDTEFLG